MNFVVYLYGAHISISVYINRLNAAKYYEQAMRKRWTAWSMKIKRCSSGGEPLT